MYFVKLQLRYAGLACVNPAPLATLTLVVWKAYQSRLCCILQAVRPPQQVRNISALFADHHVVLEPLDIVRLQLVSKRYLVSLRDNELWRLRCFEMSSFLARLRRRREPNSTAPLRHAQVRELQRSIDGQESSQGDGTTNDSGGVAQDDRGRKYERLRLLANWEPGYSTEKVDYYEEYIHRQAPLSTSWFQQPRHHSSTRHEHLEVRGMGLYNEPAGSQRFAVAPLDDGSVCLWDVSTSSGRQGSIIGRSNPGILFNGNGDIARSHMINTGVVECVSVDNVMKRAYVAVQSSELFLP